jgi:hypothetical protein
MKKKHSSTQNKLAPPNVVWEKTNHGPIYAFEENHSFAFPCVHQADIEPLSVAYERYLRAFKEDAIKKAHALPIQKPLKEPVQNDPTVLVRPLQFIKEIIKGNQRLLPFMNAVFPEDGYGTKTLIVRLMCELYENKHTRGTVLVIGSKLFAAEKNILQTGFRLTHIFTEAEWFAIPLYRSCQRHHYV